MDPLKGFKVYCYLPSCAEPVPDQPPGKAGRHVKFYSTTHRVRYFNDIRDLRELLALLDAETRAEGGRRLQVVRREMTRVRWALDSYPRANSRGPLGISPLPEEMAPRYAG